MRKKVVITDWGFPSLEPEKKALQGMDIDLVEFQCKTEEEVARAVADADVVMVQWAPVKELAIDAMKRCRGIVRYGIGLDNIDLARARERGIPVRNVPDYCLNEVADHTMALLLSLQRQVCEVDKLVRKGTWKITPPRPFPPLRQSTLGLVGFGRIARLVARRAIVFGIKVAASDPLIHKGVFEEAGVERLDLEELLEVADIVSLHCPLTDETHHTINAQSLGRMKNNALLINTSRGGLIDTMALIEVLKKNQIGGAGMDVFEQEPLPLDNELYSLPNVILTSHNAWYSSESVTELQRLAARTAVDLLKET